MSEASGLNQLLAGISLGASVINFSRLDKFLYFFPRLGIRALGCFKVLPHEMTELSTIWALVLSLFLEFLYLICLASLLFGGHELAMASGELRSLKALSTYEACVLKWDANAFHD